MLSLSISAFAKEGVNEEFIIKEIEKAIEVRKNIGHEGFEDLSPGNLISLKDEEHNVSHYLVELDKYGELGGYMILDVSSPSEPVITEFALGNVHPYQDIATSEEAYYFGL